MKLLNVIILFWVTLFSNLMFAQLKNQEGRIIHLIVPDTCIISTNESKDMGFITSQFICKAEGELKLEWGCGGCTCNCDYYQSDIFIIKRIYNQLGCNFGEYRNTIALLQLFRQQK